MDALAVLIRPLPSRVLLALLLVWQPKAQRPWQKFNLPTTFSPPLIKSLTKPPNSATEVAMNLTVVA